MGGGGQNSKAEPPIIGGSNIGWYTETSSMAYFTCNSQNATYHMAKGTLSTSRRG